MDHLHSVADFEAEAEKLSDKAAWDYISFRSGEGISYQNNKECFKRWRLRPMVMRDVSDPDVSTEIFGRRVGFPVGISPTAFHNMAHKDGECATARAAEKLNIIYIQSLFATQSMERVATAAPGCRKWFNSFIMNIPGCLEKMIERAEDVENEAIVISVDQAVRIKDKGPAGGINLPCPFTFPNFPEEIHSRRLSDPNFGLSCLIKPSATWKDLRELKKRTQMKLIAKGMLTGEMANQAIELGGVDGIIVSNHGGRLLDTVVSPLEVLPEIIKAVAGRCPVFMDGGIRSGTDILKAIILGASAVFIGRPALWGLMCGGEEGLCRILEILKNEYTLAMQLMGVSSTDELRSKSQLISYRSPL